MNTFTATAVALLSRYSNNLLKEDAEMALSGDLQGDERETAKIIQTIISFIDSFQDIEYTVHGIYRISGCLSDQQKALNIIENARGSPLKHYFIYELSPEDKANCIKTLLRKMPDTLFPQCQRTAIMDICEIATQLDERGQNDRAFKAIQILVYFIPEIHKKCLEALLTHLAKVASHSEQNKMDASNLALLFCSYIFPVTKDHNNIEEAKEEIARFNRLFPLLLRHLDQLFVVSDELIQTFDATLMSQVEEQNTTAISGNGNTSNFSSTASPFLTPIRNPSRDDPEIVMLQSCSERIQTPNGTATEMAMAQLSANIASMPEGPKRKQLLKRIQNEQRQKLGIRGGTTSGTRHKAANLIRKAFETPLKF